MAFVDYLVLGKDERGNPIRVGVTDSGEKDEFGHTLYKLGVDTSVTINNVTLGAVKVQDAVAATEAEVAANNVIAIGDNALATHDAQIGQVGDLETNGTVIGVLDRLRGVDVSLGVSGTPFHSANASAAPAAVTDAPTAGKRICVTDLMVSVAVALTVTISEETSGKVLMIMNLAPYQTVSVNLKGKFKVPTADKRLMVQTNQAGIIDVWCQYYSE